MPLGAACQKEAVSGRRLNYFCGDYSSRGHRVRLEGFGFSGVKGFADFQGMDLEDLNLVYGANSSGKSTLLQVLLLLQQSTVRPFAAQPGVLEFRGGSIDLGGYRTFLHGHDTSHPMTLEINVKRDVRHRGYFRSYMHGGVDLRLSFASDDNGQPVLSNVAIVHGGVAIRFVREADKATFRLADASSSAKVVDDFFKAIAEEKPKGVTATSEADRRWLREWVRKHSSELSGWIPLWHPSAVGPGRPGRPAGGRLDSPRQILLQWFVYAWYDFANDFGWELNQLLEDMTYVGPLRAFPRRVVTEAGSGAKLGSRGERLVLHLARRPELVERVNRCFELLDLGYELSVEQLSGHSSEDALGDVAIAVLTDRSTGLSVSPADVGFGISQILPVVVQLVGNTDSIILIEQPEIHLHPRMQSRLADVLIAAAVENRNTVVIETHSEHILTRLQRRYRERSAGSLAAQLPSVGVHYVRSSDGFSSIERIDLDVDGRMLAPWPDDFLDERLDDLFASL